MGERFTGLLRRPADVANPALVAGMDSSKEEFHAIAEGDHLVGNARWK